MESLGVNTSGASSANALRVEVGSGDHLDLQDRPRDGIKGITSLALALSFFALSLFFLLKDGPSMRAAVDQHLGVPEKVAETITGGVITSLRGYFKGVTIVAAFNGVVVALGALILGVPLAGTIGLVTFVTRTSRTSARSSPARSPS